MNVYFMLTLLGVLSLAVGSFISAITYRIPRGLGFVTGRSFCDSCKKELRWYDNIPIFSFLFYRAKSRCCDKPISVRYPLIEIISVVGSLTIWFVFHNLAFVFLFFLTFCVLIIDLEHQIIPDGLSLLIFILAIIFTPIPFLDTLFVGFFCAALLELLHLLTRGRGMGMGDVKLAIALGMWFPLLWSIKWLMSSFILGGIFAVVLLVLKRANLKTKIAFGPFLIVGFWLVLFLNKLYQ